MVKRLISEARGGMIFVLARLCSMALAGCGSVWAVRQLGPDKVGVSASVSAWIAPALLFAQLGMQPLVSREYQLSGNKLEYLYVVLIKRALLTTAIVVALIMYIAVVGIPAGYGLAVVGGVILFLSQQLTPTWVLLAEERMGWYLALTLTPSILCSVMYFIFISSKSPAGSDLLYQSVFLALAQIPAWMLVWNRHRGECVTFDRSLWRRLCGMVFRGRWLFFSGVTIYVYTAFERPYLAYACGARELGLYQSAITLTMLVVAVFGLIQQMLYPRFVAWNHESGQRLYREVNRLFRQSVLVLAPLCLAGTFAHLMLYERVFGDQFAGATYPALVLVYSKVVVFLNGLYGWALWADASNDRTMAYLMFFVAIISWLLNLAMVPRFGMMGAACVNLLSETLILLGVSILFNRKYGVEKLA